MDISLILTKIFLGKKWTITGTSYEGLVWLDESKKPTKKDFEKMWESVVDEEYNETNKNNRKEAYKEEADHLFFDYQRGEVDKKVWTDKVEEIRKRYPYKPHS